MSGLTISPKATSREACDQLLRLLSSFSQYNDAAVCELLRLHPETCTVKYNFGYGNMDVYPLFQLVFLQASMHAIHLAYQAHPFAIYEPDQNGNFPLHVACASRASLEVLLQLVEWLPWAVKSTNAAGRTPLHLACHRHATLPVIRFLVWKYPLSLVMRAKDGCTPREDAAKAAVHQRAPNMSTPPPRLDDERATTEEEEEAILLEFLEYAETELDIALLERRSALEAAVMEWKAQSQLYGDDKAFALAATAQRHLTWMEPFLELLPPDDDESIVAASSSPKQETKPKATLPAPAKTEPAPAAEKEAPAAVEKVAPAVVAPPPPPPPPPVDKRAVSPDPPGAALETSTTPVAEAIPVALVEAVPEVVVPSPPSSPPPPAWSTNITVVASKEVEEEKKEGDDLAVTVPTAVTTKDLPSTAPTTPNLQSTSSFNWCAITDALGWCPMAAVDEDPVLPPPPPPLPPKAKAAPVPIATTHIEVTTNTITEAAEAISQPATSNNTNKNNNANVDEAPAEPTGDWCSSLEALEDEILPMIPPSTPPHKRKSRTVASPTHVAGDSNQDELVQPPRPTRLVVVEDDTNNVTCSSPIMFLENALSGVGLSPNPTNDDLCAPAAAVEPVTKPAPPKAGEGTATAPIKKEAAEVPADKLEDVAVNQEADPIIYYDEEKKEPDSPTKEPVFTTVEDEITPQVSNASFQISPKSAVEDEPAQEETETGTRPDSPPLFPRELGGSSPVDNDLADFLASVGLQITNDGLVNPVLPPSSPEEEEYQEEYQEEDANSHVESSPSSTNNDPPAQVITTLSKTFEDEADYDEVEEERSAADAVDENQKYNTYQVSEEDMPEYNYNDEYHRTYYSDEVAHQHATPAPVVVHQPREVDAALPAVTAVAAAPAAANAAVQAHREAEELALTPRRHKYRQHEDDRAVYTSPDGHRNVYSPGNRSGASSHANHSGISSRSAATPVDYHGKSTTVPSPAAVVEKSPEAYTLQTPTRASRNGNSSNNSNSGSNNNNIMYHREQMVRAWLLKYLPTLREEDLTLYANRLVEDGFDSVDMLENELMEEDLDFMRKAHKRSMGRKKFLESEGY